MIRTNRSVLVGIAAGLIALFVVPEQAAYAATDDKVAERLGRARIAYEATMQRVRSDIERALDPVDAAAERQAFRETGAVPDAESMRPHRVKAAKAAESLLDAYAKAIAQYAAADQRVLASAVESELGLFRSQSDLVPWQANLMEGWPEEERTVATDGEPVVLNTLAPEAYRVEVKGKSVGGAGVMIVELPVSDGRRLSVPCAADVDGEIGVVLTVRGSTVSADLGVVRPIDLAGMFAGDSSAVVFRADVGTIRVESVRMKPVIAGSPEDASALSARPKGGKPEKQAKQTAGDLMPVGSVWRGDVTHSSRGTFDTRFEVTTRTQDRIIMKGSWVDRITLEFEYKYRGKDLTLVGVRELSKTGGTRTGAKGSGAVSGGTLTSTYSWRVTGGPLKNQSISGSMSLEQE